MAWQHRDIDHAVALVGAQLGETPGIQMHLRQHLIGEGAIHHPRGVAGGVAQVDQTPLGQQVDHIAAVGIVRLPRPGVTVDLVHLGLDLLPEPLLAHVGGIDLAVEVADIADHRAILESAQHGGVTGADIAGAGHHQVGLAEQFEIETVDATIDTAAIGRNHLEAIHAGLHGTDRVDLGDPHDHAFLAQRGRRPLAHVPVAHHQCLLARQQVIEPALDGVIQTVTAAILVVILRLGDGVVDVDGRHFQGACPEHLEQSMDTGGGLFTDAVDDVKLVGKALMQQQRQVTAIIQHQIGGPAVGAIHRLLDTPPELVLALALPGKYRDACCGDGGGGVVLGGKDIAGRPAYARTKVDQGLDQHRGLNRHVDTAGDTCALERLNLTVPGPEGHQGRHLAFGDANLAAPPVGQADIGDPVVTLTLSPLRPLRSLGRSHARLLLIIQPSL